MAAVDPGWAQPASDPSLGAGPGAAASHLAPMAQVASIIRLVVLLTVALMLRARDVLGPVEPLDVLLIVGSAYVVVTTFWPRQVWSPGHAHILLTCDILFISGLVWLTGGTRSEYYLLYYLPILHGASRLDFRDAIMTSVLAGLSYFFISIATGPLVPVVTTSLLRAATFGGSVVVLAVFFGALAQEARANRALTVRLQEALESVSAVYDVARAASTHDSVQDVLDTMLRQAMRLSEADAAALAMLDDDGKFQVLARQHNEDALPPEFDEGLARQAVESRECVARRGGPQAAQRSPQARQPVREIFIPLQPGRSPLGVMQIRTSAPNGLAPRDIELLRALCAEGAMAIDNVRLRAETKRAAAVDYLTGLCNRREFERRLEAEIRRTARHGGSVSLVLLDADDFKRCNDSYGHQAGDQVLQAIGARIEAVIRTEDTAARYGGDEFAIILPQTDIAGASAVAEKIQRELQSLRFSWPDESWRPTVSFGIAACEDELSASLLLQKADRALYGAKGSGKNRACVWRRGAQTPWASAA